ncbi:MAG: acetoin dehydrogenase, partial [Alphaproteobacteria bacterium]|nr:acetoin dehydrogenase [Alphaproteobacteria bacterium]
PIEPVGGARVVRPGNDVTVVALGPMVGMALAAAATLAEEGVEIEVVDPRWLAPLDAGTILASVSRTGRLVVAHEANVTGGFGAEVAARVARDALWSLEAPIERVGLPDVRVPAAPSLQAAIAPTAADIVAAVRRVLVA